MQVDIHLLIFLLNTQNVRNLTRTMYSFYSFPSCVLFLLYCIRCTQFHHSTLAVYLLFYILLACTYLVDKIRRRTIKGFKLELLLQLILSQFFFLNFIFNMIYMILKETMQWALSPQALVWSLHIFSHEEGIILTKLV